MSNHDQGVQPGSELDLAIDRALEGADLRAGGATFTAFVAERETVGVEDGPAGADDGD